MSGLNDSTVSSAGRGDDARPAPPRPGFQLQPAQWQPPAPPQPQVYTGPRVPPPERRRRVRPRIPAPPWIEPEPTQSEVARRQADDKLHHGPSRWLEITRRLIADTFRVLAGHWPQLVGIFLIGAIGRMGFLWLASWVSRFSSTAAIFILPLAPLATLTALVFMLRVTADSLPAFRDAFQDVTRAMRLRQDFLILVAIMLPFLTVYASQGLLAVDQQIFVVDAIVEAELENPVVANTRIDYASGWVLVGLIVGALFLRRLLEVSELGSRLLVFAVAEAYLEAFWMMSVGNAFSAQFGQFMAWFQERSLVIGIGDLWERFLALSDALRATVEWLAGATSWLWASFMAVLFMPLAWLAIGAMIYEPDLDELDLRAPSSTEIRGRVSQRTQRLLRVSPKTAKLLGHAIEPVVEPVTETWGGVRRILSAGIAPAVIFSGAFIVLGYLQSAVAGLLSAIIGPREPSLAFAVGPYIELGYRLVYFVCTMALLASAVNVLIILGRRDALPKRVS